MDKEIVAQAKREAEEAYSIYINIKKDYLSAESDWVKKLEKFKKLDYQLALTDGRFKRYSFKEYKQKEYKQKEPPNLTLEQIQGILSKLGINLIEY